MKKTIFTLLCSFTGLTMVQAQTPEMKSRSLVCKFTETWCGPCGGWGWNLANQVIADIGDKGYYVGVMGSSTPSSMNANCYGPFESNFPVGGYPTFIVNDEDGGSYLSEVSGAYNTFAATTPVASPAAYFTISGTTINVTSKTKFWTGTSGEYYVSALVVENKVLAAQNGQSGTPEHHYLLRGSMMANKSPWGMLLYNGAIAANTEYSQDFSMTMGAGWNADNISVLVAIYKKDGTKYRFVNVIQATNNTTGLRDNEQLAAASVYPNPATAEATLSLSLKNARKVAVTVTDLSGRVVYQQSEQALAAGTTNIKIPVQQFAAGCYNISVKGEGVYTNEALVVSK
ncbi:T9SS type A sorting domain-containing protein [Edaphocola aurantiacus]|uniref:T9SS type A sorting domain-containing protein n=1 Tax=Edaphocola aurantiacus TaxID=2601682 RepID=UPI001C96EB5E|nr:Omp28-related outer membrane protein [Edaphocola aurantiacus]